MACLAFAPALIDRPRDLVRLSTEEGLASRNEWEKFVSVGGAEPERFEVLLELDVLMLC